MNDRLTAPAWCMSAAARIRSGLTVELTMHATGQIYVERDPAPPKRLTPEELDAYRRARNELIAAWSECTGQSVLLLEV